MKHFTKFMFLTFLSIMLGNLHVWGQEVLFYESFDKCKGTGGNDNSWSGSIATGTAIYDNTGWEASYIAGANKCVKLGTGNYSGWVTTPSLNLNGDATLTFKAGSWSGKNSVLTVTINNGGGTLDGQTTINLPNAQFNDYTLTIKNGNPNTKITFRNSAKNKQFFLDEVKIVSTTTIAKHNIITVVSPENSGTVATTNNVTEIAEGTTTTITATANSTYQFDHWTVSGENSSIDDIYTNPATFTMGTEDATVTAYFREKQAIDPTVSFTTDPAEVEIGKTFTNEITKPEDLTVTYAITSGSDYATIDENTGKVTGVAVGQATVTASWAAVPYTYNAGVTSYTLNVVAQKPTVVYEKVTSTDAITSGSKYLIVYEDGNVAFNGSLETLDAANNTQTVEINNNKISVDDSEDNFYFIIEKDNSNYYIKSASGKYIGKSSTGNGLETSNTATLTNTISINSDNAVITGSGNPILKYNKASDQNRFRYYGSGQQPIQLYKEAINFTITAVSDNDNYGTVSVSGLTITASPADGYRVRTESPYEVINGTASVTQNGNNFTVLPTSDCTIKIFFEEIPTHTATFYNNGSMVSDNSYREGATITFPDTPADIEDYHFVGWTTAEIESTQETAPTLITPPVSMSTTNVTYYAVYAEGSSTTITKWKKIGDASNIDGAGVYALLTHEDTEGDNAAYAFKGTMDSKNLGEPTTSYFEFDSEGYADSAPEGTCELTFTSVTVDGVSGYTIYNNDHGYLYAGAASKENLKWHDNESSYWRFERINNKNEWLYKVNSSDAYLRVFNNTFRTYGNSSNDNVYFAKKVTVSVGTLSNYRTKVAVTITFQKQNTSMYYSAYNLTVPEGVIAKTYKVANGKPVISKTYQAGETIAKATAVILTLPDQPSNAANLGLTKEFRLASTGVADEDNKLVGWDEATQVSTYYLAEEYIAYVLSTKNGDNPGFYFMSGHPQGDTNFQSGAHKAVFPVLKSEASSSKSAWLFSEIDDEVTGISDASIMNNEERAEHNGVYDLQGRKVTDNLSSILSHPSSQKGIYIVNGKKVIIR